MKELERVAVFFKPKDRISRLFIISALVFGLLFVLITPPFCSFDESTHSYRAYQLSEFNFTADSLPGGGTGGFIPASLYQSATKYRSNYFGGKHDITWGDYKHDIKSSLNEQEKVPVHFENTALYSLVGYLPHMVAFWITKPIDTSPIITLYLARLFYLVLWIVFAGLAINILRAKKLFAALILLMPMSLFLAGSVSLDGITIALSALLVALISFYAVKPRLDAKDISLATLVASALALIKLPYFMFVAALVFIGKNKAPKNKLIYLLIPVIAAMVLGGIWAMIANSNYLPYRNDIIIDPPTQLKNMLTNPFHFVTAIFNTYFTNFGNQIIKEFVGVLGSNNSLLPSWISYMWVSLLVLTAVYGTKAEQKFKKHFRLLTLALIGLLFVAVNALLYMSWTGLNADFIDGAMGRYFIPLALMLAMPLSGISLLKVNARKFEYACFGIAWLGLIAALISMMQYNYRIFS
jgi:uncharacterized membrane protein